MFLELRSSDTTKLCVYCHTNRQTMAHSYIRLYFHLTFHTKTATPIQKEDLSDVYAYMSGVFHRYNITPLSIGGVGDHVHAILQFKESVIDFATVIRDVKTASNYGAENEAYKLGVCENETDCFLCQRVMIDLY